MGMLQEFKEFAIKGNVVDMAVGLIVGASFGKIVSSFVAESTKIASIAHINILLLQYSYTHAGARAKQIATTQACKSEDVLA